MARLAGPGVPWPWLRAAAAAPALLAASPAADAGMVKVTMSGVRDDRGVVRVALCVQAEFLAEHCAHNAAAPARMGVVAVTFAGIALGAYAAQAWHDQNNNGHLDRNALGIPREDVGFSNDPALPFGPPAFRDALFTVSEAGGRVALRL